MTCARTAPTASARSRTLVSSCPCPRSSVSVMISASCFSASQRIATEVSRPPEYARTIRRMLRGPPFLEPLREPGGIRCAAANHQDRIVAGNRADDLRQPRAIDGDGQRLCLPCVRLQNDQLIDDVVAAEVIVNGRAAFFFGVDAGGQLGPRAAVRPVRGALDQAQVTDVAGQRGLGGVDASAAEPLPQLFLARDRLSVHDFQDGGLPVGFHNYADASWPLYSICRPVSRIFNNLRLIQRFK